MMRLLRIQLSEHSRRHSQCSCVTEKSEAFCMAEHCCSARSSIQTAANLPSATALLTAGACFHAALLKTPLISCTRFHGPHATNCSTQTKKLGPKLKINSYFTEQ